MSQLNPVRHTLANGLRVLVSRDPATPVAAVCLRYAAGSRDEPPGLTGLAHLFEHLMFQGSTHVDAGGHAAAIEEAGGFTNASTGFERTIFFSVVPAARLELLLWLEADRMGGLLDALAPAGLDTQRKVVLNERQERYENVPYGTGLEQLVEMSFAPGHPYRHLPAGRPRDLAAVTLEDCRTFFRTHYTPGRTILSVVGDVDPDTVLAQVERHFGHVPAGRPGYGDQWRVEPPGPDPTGPDPAIGPDPAEPRPPAESRRSAPQAVPAPALMAAFQLPALGAPGHVAADLALTLLGGLSSSRLHHRMVRTGRLAHSARFSLLPLHGAPSLGWLNVRAATGTGLGEVEAAVGEEIRRFAEEPVPPRALAGAKAQITRDRYDRLATPTGRADDLCAREARYARTAAAVTWDAERDELLGINAEDVRQAAARWLDPRRGCVLTYGTNGIRSANGTHAAAGTRAAAASGGSA